MKKRMLIMLISLGILFGVIFIYKAVKGFLINRYLSAQLSPVVTVSTTKVDYAAWQPRVKAVGSLRAITGVNVTTSLAGMVQDIYFTPGALVSKGTVLVQLNADMEIGQLQALKAQAELAKLTYKRDKAQYAAQAISKQQLDNDQYNLQNLQGQVAEQAATVEKKTIRAPFSGRLGINNINLGQYVNTGDKIVTLQTLDPIYIDFYVPQQALAQLEINQAVTVVSDAYPHKKFKGKITTIEPAIDTNTRNVEVEATLANPKLELVPGMFASVTVSTGKSQRYLTLSQAAISFNPYGDIVYVVKETGKDEQGKPILAAHQAFVVTGETRGDQVTILQGLKAGDVVVTSGQLKLKNGSRVAINNTVEPSDNPAPIVKNES